MIISNTHDTFLFCVIFSLSLDGVIHNYLYTTFLFVILKLNLMVLSTQYILLKMFSIL